MTVRVFRSTDYNAPVMNGQASPTNTALINVLTACLVDGYNLPAVSSITHSGAVATVTSPAHGLVGTAKVTIAGATQTEYNGTFSVTVTGTNTFTYTMSGTPASNATGTPTARLDGAGWTKPLTGTGLAAFLQGTGESWARYLRVDDTVGASARLIGYESMSDINNGAGLFPTAALLPSGAYMTKSATTDAVVRAWVLVATERWFTLIINQSGTATASSIMSFGDIASYVSGDQYKTILIASNSATVNTSNYGYGGLALHTAAPTNEAKCIARPYTGVGSGVKVNLTGALSVATNMTFIGNGATTAMNGSAGGTTSIVDGALYQSPIMVTESSAYRGMLPEHPRAGASGCTIPGESRRKYFPLL